MKRLSGKYSEIELLRIDSGDKDNSLPAGRGVQLKSREWDQTVQRLAGMFGDNPAAAGVPATTKLSYYYYRCA